MMTIVSLFPDNNNFATSKSFLKAEARDLQFETNTEGFEVASAVLLVASWPDLHSFLFEMNMIRLCDIYPLRFVEGTIPL